MTTSFLSNLAADVERTYRNLAICIFEGEQPDPAKIFQIAVDAGRSLNDLAADVERLQARADAIEALNRIEADSTVADAKAGLQAAMAAKRKAEQALADAQQAAYEAGGEMARCQGVASAAMEQESRAKRAAQAELAETNDPALQAELERVTAPKPSQPKPEHYWKWDRASRKAILWRQQLDDLTAGPPRHPVDEQGKPLVCLPPWHPGRGHTINLEQPFKNGADHDKGVATVEEQEQKAEAMRAQLEREGLLQNNKPAGPSQIDIEVARAKLNAPLAINWSKP